ncbi:MAG: type I-C CRISPR-associated protein Cas8c/Csd1, partial [Deltaproteobacteria bacterium]|nr:type I-C CRISPR-associated protein Cas8c/Csd1 [Deltaproteobacteria bacterium]
KKDSVKLAERARVQHASFVTKIKDIFSATADTGVCAVIKFLESCNFTGVFLHPLWPEIEENGANVTFQLEGDFGLICQRDAVEKAIAERAGGDESGECLPCLVTGLMEAPVRLHTAIKGVWGAQSFGANIVSFNLNAFNSFGKDQGFNAPVGKKAEHAYVTAINTLLAKDSRQRIQVGDASTIFWAEAQNNMEELFKDFFGEPPKGQSVQDNEAIKALYKAPESGAPPLEDDLTKFYVLGLSPNASRIAIRFWYAGTVSDVAKNIKEHFVDCKIVHGPKEPEYLSLFRLLISTAMEGKADNIQPNLSGELMRAILAGTPYPVTLLSSVIRRVKAEREITYPRASLLKALLVRQSRFYNRKEKEVGMSLDDSNKNIGYLLGRLFAVLERAQGFASPGLNATIRDRFYGAASGTPVAAFPQLMKLKNHHIAKLENRGAAINLEKLIGSIMEGVSDFPTHLSLQDQGRFAVGYYHQRQSFFTKKDGE